jgi:hypothetical protein
MTTTTLRSALTITGVRKSFGKKVVLDGIDLDIAEGTTFSLLGPNGAGKTTTVQILSTLLSADAGEVHVAGFDVKREPDAVRAAIGVTGQFSAVDNLDYLVPGIILMTASASAETTAVNVCTDMNEGIIARFRTMAITRTSVLTGQLPFVSSAFVPTGSIPAGVRRFAQNQPFTPVIETLRGLLTGAPIGHSAILAAAWCASIIALGYLWARAQYNRNPTR